MSLSGKYYRKALEGQLKIHLVEDQFAIYELYQDLFESPIFSVSLCKNFDEAEASLEELWHFAVVDIMLNDSKERTGTDYLKRVVPRPYSVAVSTTRDIREGGLCLKAGAADILVKDKALENCMELLKDVAARLTPLGALTNNQYHAAFIDLASISLEKDPKSLWKEGIVKNCEEWQDSIDFTQKRLQALLDTLYPTIKVTPKKFLKYYYCIQAVICEELGCSIKKHSEASTEPSEREIWAGYAPFYCKDILKDALEVIKAPKGTLY